MSDEKKTPTALADIDPAKLERLPKWARDTMTLMARTIEEQHRKLTAGPEDSNTFATGHASWRHEDETPLGKWTPIRFQTTKNGHNVSIQVRLTDDGSLQIHGDRSLTVSPQSSNTITLRIED